uniref:Putative GIY-YIG homing endonuclease n=1 Tax=Dunaliella salina TaxID=3046 RepID=A0A1C8XRI7_DUNSA|nr:putative GIY-YIG homing endonuclease [Dunaliella salina]
MGPGLYVIWNTAMKKFYVGQSNNVTARLSSHWNELKIKRHECKLMQEHWNSIGSQHFKFISLDIDEKWENEEKRKDAELELIHLNDSVVYNILTSVKGQKHKLTMKKAYKTTLLFFPTQKV